jgi:delta8-fatty-acid desaturase
MVAGALVPPTPVQDKNKPLDVAEPASPIQSDVSDLPELPESVKPSASSSKIVIEEECILTIDGKTYDLTKWADHHPGGPLIRQYNGLDATHVFYAFHSQDAVKKLASFKPMKNPPTKSVPLPKDIRSQQILDDFDAFKQDLEDKGFFETSLLWYLYKASTTLLLAGIGLGFHFYHWYFMSAIFFGLFWQQLGWLGHECAHHQVFTNRNLNKTMALFFGNICQGFSSHWWKDRHNSHHATTNILDADPDIDNIPMLAWAPSDLDKAPKWCLKYIPYQSYYFLLLLPILRLAWVTRSITFVGEMRTSKYKQYRYDFPLEALTLFIHWSWVFALHWTLPTWGWVITYFIVSECLAGFGIAIVVFFNHYSCEKYPSALAGNFVCLQLWTTRNMTPGIFTDWICGGLNYQIEHHLFPTMPRHNLYRASFLVKQFCKDHDLPYLCSDFGEGLQKVLAFLDSIGAIARERNEQMKKEQTTKKSS